MCTPSSGPNSPSVIDSAWRRDPLARVSGFGRKAARGWTNDEASLIIAGVEELTVVSMGTVGGRSAPTTFARFEAARLRVG